MNQQKAPGVDLDSRKLAETLLDLWQQSEGSDGFDKDLFITKLVSYIVRRDHQIHNHAFHLGKNQTDNEGQANYSQKASTD